MRAERWNERGAAESCLANYCAKQVRGSPAEFFFQCAERERERERGWFGGKEGLVVWFGSERFPILGGIIASEDRSEFYR